MKYQSNGSDQAAERKRPLWRTATVALSVIGLAAGVAACGGGSSVVKTSGSSSSGTGASTQSSSAATTSGSVTYAEDPDATPNWIMPIVTPSHLQAYNTSNVNLLYPTIYAFADNSAGSMAIDAAVSPAETPVYSDGDKTVTITLKPWKWSNGQPVTSRDIEFWFNLVEANKSEWGNYAVGDIPDNVKSFRIVNQQTFQLQLTKAFSPGWYTANELTNINLMPQAVWDKTSANGKVGDYDTTAAGAKQVFSFLVSQAEQLSTYQSNPLWQVVAGPFKISSWTNTGQVTFVPNTDYSGGDKPRMSSLVEVPFTSEQSEFLALRSGSVDYGYLPAQDIPQESEIKSQGYSIDPWWGWEITYLQYNYNNPTLGPIFDQLYIRQAIQHAINQPQIAKVIWGGTAEPDYGPIPVTPKSQYLSAGETDNPYPYDPSASKSLLSAHGWVKQNGVETCEHAGTGSSDCGTGISQGAKLAFKLISESGSPETTQQDDYLQSAMSAIGVDLNVQEEPLNSVLAATVPCKAGASNCNWDISYFGTQGSWNFPPFPSGDQPFLSGSAGNLGSYNSPEADKLIEATLTSSSLANVYAYEKYMADDLPVVWMPNPAFQISAISDKLKGVVQNPLLTFTPQSWYLAK